MAAAHKLLPCLVAAATGVAPPAVIPVAPPARPLTLPASHAPDLGLGRATAPGPSLLAELFPHLRGSQVGSGGKAPAVLVRQTETAEPVVGKSRLVSEGAPPMHVEAASGYSGIASLDSSGIAESGISRLRKQAAMASPTEAFVGGFLLAASLAVASQWRSTVSKRAARNRSTAGVTDDVQMTPVAPNHGELPPSANAGGRVAVASFVGESGEETWGPRSPGSAHSRPFKLSCQAGPCGSPSAPFTLRYFDGRGVAETVRLIFAVSGEAYEDKRYPISFGTPGDFSTLKREEFDADKAAGKMDVAMGKLPVLDGGPDFSLPQSKAIERYLARKFGMMGKTPEEEAWVDALCEHVRDINDAYARKGLFGLKDEAKKKEIQDKWFGEELPVMLDKLEKSLPENNSGNAIGESTSLADVVIFKLIEDTYQDRKLSMDSLPKLAAIATKLKEHEGLQKWISERPQTMF